MREIRSLRLVALLLPSLAWGQSAQFNLSQFSHYLTTGGQSYTGTSSVGTAAPSKFIVSPDTFTNTAASNPLVSAFEIDHNFGGAFQGLAEGMQITLVMTSATSNSTPATSQYTALGLVGQANTSDGGTGGTPKGSLYGFNPNVRITGSVANWNLLVGEEIDISAFSGSTLTKKIGSQVVQTSLDAVSGSLENLGYVLANQSGATGWQVGLSFGNYDGFWPMTSTGTLIGCYPHGNTGGCGTAGIGIDFSNVTLTTDFLKSTGYTVDGSGNETSNSLTTGALTATGGAINLNNCGSIGAGAGSLQVKCPLISAAGTKFSVASGTGTCVATGTVTGGVQAGQFTCTTAGTAASTVTLTLAATSNAYTCWGRDVTTPTTVTQTGVVSTTSVTLTLVSVTSNDVIQVGCLGY